jgi:plastocyanin
MDNELLFYLCGGVLAASAVLVTFVGLKSKNFPGRALPLVVVWFAVFMVGASTFAVLHAEDEQEHKAHELEQAAKKIEEGSSGPYENEAGALGGETEELEEEAEKGAEDSEEEEPVGPTEDSQQKQSGEQDGQSGASKGGGAGAEAATTLQLAADPTQLLFDGEELSAKAGKVTIDFDNPSAIPHNVVVLKDGKELAGTPEITESKASVSVDVDPGSYEFICSVPGHAEAGMKGTLSVE